MEDFVVIGKIADTYGLNQELKVLAYLPPKEWKGIKKVISKNGEEIMCPLSWKG
jgi:16S rRNA processing protein RimM